MAKELKRSRDVGRAVERELWARAAGRCEFNGCNRPLFKSPITQERVNISETAHIYSFSERGPRGWNLLRLTPDKINDISNLMLVCHDCHKTIDQDLAGSRYSADLLREWKEEHERRIAIVTGIAPHRKSHVVLYGANIGEASSPLSPEAAIAALPPNKWFPADERPISLSMLWHGEDHEANFWETEVDNLRTNFDRYLRPLISSSASCHFSVFAFAPMPLLTQLGALLTDRTQVEVYQLHREPYLTWKWLEEPAEINFLIRRPEKISNPPALVISLSACVSQDRVTSAIDGDLSIWEITIENPHNDFLRSRAQLGRFREVIRQLLAEIGRVHGRLARLSIFPAMPVACAVELGRVRMPKADGTWDIYDHNGRRGGFARAITIA